MQQHGKAWDPRFPFDPARFPVFYGWVIMVAATLGMVASIPGQTIGVSVYTDIYLEALGLSRIQLTTAYLLGTGLSGLLVSAGGSLFDRLGARRFFVMAVILFGLALAFMSQMDRLVELAGMAGVTAVAMAVASMGFLGIRFFGQGMVTLGSKSMLSKWWNLRRGLVVSINGCFVAFGFSIAPRVIDWEIQILGWRGSLLCNAFLLMIPMAAVAWLVFRDNPEECGLEMDNGWRPKSRRENPDTLLKKEFTRAEAMRTYSFWIITLALGFQGLYATSFTFHVLDIGRNFGVPREAILNTFIYSSVVSVAVNLSVGYITDFIRIRFVIVFFCFCGVLFTSGVLLLPGSVGYIMTVIGMGTTWGTFPVLSSVAYPRYFGRQHLGAITGASLASLVWGSAVGPLAFSFCRDYLGGYRTAMVASLLVYSLLGIGGFFATNPSSRIGSLTPSEPRGNTGPR